MPEPFKVFCGWDRRQAEAAEVFKFSVEQNASIDVDVQFLQLDKLPIDRVGVTSFTYSRFLVPWLCGYEGRALYGDGCDQLCLGDVAELASWDMQGKPLWVVKHPPLRKVPLRRPRSWTSLMLMDCANNAGWFPDTVARWPDDALMRLKTYTDDEIGELPQAWNMLVDPDGPPVSEDHLLGVKIAHWSHLSDPNGGSWIDRSGSALWAEWRQRWRVSRGLGGPITNPGRPKKSSAAA